jgi:hypothetical protein
MTTKKEKCKDIMARLFGPASANLVDSLSEEEVVQKCREKVLMFMGEEKASEFDNI